MKEAEINELSLIDCSVQSLTDLKLSSNLTSIVLHSNKLNKIENLTGLQNLIHLDLSSNRIQKINGLECLVGLHTLNLSCNQIKIIEGVQSLKKLKYLNLSFNKIQSLSGLLELSGTAYSLESLLLHGNSIQDSLSDVLFILSNLFNLKRLTLYDNPVTANKNYGQQIKLKLKQLVSLDSREQAVFDLKLLPGFEQYEQYLTEAANSSQSSFSSGFVNSNPKINIIEKPNEHEIEATNISKPQKHKAKEWNKSEKMPVKSNPKINNKSIFQNDVKPETKTTETNTDAIIAVQKTSVYTQTNLPDKTDDLKNELNVLKTIVKEMKDENKTTATKNDTVANYQKLFANEKTKSNGLYEKLAHYQHVICDMKQQIESYKESQESNLGIIKQLEANISSLNQTKDENEAKLKLIKENNQLLKRELETLRHSFNATQIQLQKLQDSLINKEIKQPTSKTEAYVKIDSEEFKRYINCEIDRYKELSKLEMNQQIEKNEMLKKEYKSLEDEFRAALLMEAKRYNDLFILYDKANQSATHFKQSFSQSKEREERDKTLILELNSLIKEQKIRLQDLVKNRNELNENIKKQDSKIVELTNKESKSTELIGSLKKEKSELVVRIQALECLLDGLRQEKKLWSQELAQQGSLLAQDRGRLEAKIETQQSEISTLKKHLDREVDNVKIKAKIIEDQTDSIKKLKDAFVERDADLKKYKEEFVANQKAIEKQLQDEALIKQDLQNKYDRAVEKRDLMKSQLVESQQQLAKIQLSYNDLSQKWKDKSDLINELDTKVRQMKENYDSKENSLVDEKNKCMEENRQLQQRLRKIDDEFRRQLDLIQKECQEQKDRLKNEYEKKIEESEYKVFQIENEMRTLLKEMNDMKKQNEEKFKKLTKAFSELGFK